ncbi:2675_t:CDS:1 [Paraglomus occultum]|uniref:2675_t:CDS:1 n=1 Tax=Paraglomus occultum TaxID=144539 RepID=A0A9N8W8N9_9GLOM|nr:2675_t:CDS:1 [Paraglomus occultum]
MHPAVVASMVVGGVVVLYAVYCAVKEYIDEPIDVLVDNEKSERETKVKSEDKQSTNMSTSVVASEATSLRQRTRTRTSRQRSSDSQATTSQVSMIQKHDVSVNRLIILVHRADCRYSMFIRCFLGENDFLQSEEEERLLEQLSYFTAVEQEIERRKRRLAAEEDQLLQREREIQRRRQYLESLSDSHSSPASSENGTSEAHQTSTTDLTAVSSTPAVASALFDNSDIKQTSPPPYRVVDPIALTGLSSIPAVGEADKNNNKTTVDSNTLAEQKPIRKRVAASEEEWCDVGSVASETFGTMSSAADVDWNNLK